MSTSVELLGSREAWTPQSAKPLDQAVWQAWVAKGRAEDQRSSAARIKAVKWVSIAGLLAAELLGSHLASFDVLIRCVVTGGAMVVMLQFLHARRYACAALFGALALLYNPVAPVFSFSGGWQLAVVVASAAPFVASLRLAKAKQAHHD